MSSEKKRKRKASLMQGKNILDTNKVNNGNKVKEKTQSSEPKFLKHMKDLSDDIEKKDNDSRFDISKFERFSKSKILNKKIESDDEEECNRDKSGPDIHQRMMEIMNNEYKNEGKKKSKKKEVTISKSTSNGQNNNSVSQNKSDTVVIKELNLENMAGDHIDFSDDDQGSANEEDDDNNVVRDDEKEKGNDDDDDDDNDKYEDGGEDSDDEDIDQNSKDDEETGNFVEKTETKVEICDKNVPDILKGKTKLSKDPFFEYDSSYSYSSDSEDNDQAETGDDENLNDNHDIHSKLMTISKDSEDIECDYFYNQGGFKSMFYNPKDNEIRGDRGSGKFENNSFETYKLGRVYNHKSDGERKLAFKKEVLRSTEGFGAKGGTLKMGKKAKLKKEKSERRGEKNVSKSSEKLHPSWEASKKRKEQSSLVVFKGNKKTFEDSD